MDHPRNKVATSYRLSPTALALITALTKRLGLSQAGVLEMAVRKLAAQEGIEVDTKEDQQTDGTERE